MNKKKLVVVLAALVAVLTLAIGGTLAYFTDTEQKTNVMAIGNVEINIEELMKNPDGTDPKYVKFDENDITLYPVENSKGINLYNKLVSVFNTSEQDAAYIRTIVLFEANNDVKSCEDDCCMNGVHFAYTDGDYVTLGKQGRGTTNQLLKDTITYNGKEWHVVVFTDVQGRAIAKDESQDSLTSVWLDAHVTDEEATAWGGNVEVVVLAQGIQSAHLTHAEAMEALGEVNEDNINKWFGEEVDEAVINDVY